MSTTPCVLPSSFYPLAQGLAAAFIGSLTDIPVRGMIGQYFMLS